MALFNKPPARPDDGLISRLEALESAVRLLKVEWEDVLDRLDRIMGRMNARLRRATSSVEPLNEPPPTPQVDPITARVLARRNARNGVSSPVRPIEG